MNRFFCALVALLGIVLFTSPPAPASEPAVYPKGFAGPSNIVAGLYPANDAGSCCWVGPRATIKLAVPAGVDTLLLNVYLPDFAVRSGAQSLRVQIDGTPPVVRCCIGAGEHEITIPLPPSTRRGTLTVQLWCARTFVPMQLGLNLDQRHLGMMLREVGFLDAATGERLDNAPLPWMPARAAVPVLLLCGVVVLLLTLRRPLYGLLALIATDPFLFAYSVHGTTVTLPKIVLLAVALGLVPRLAQIVAWRPLRALFLIAGAQLLFVLTMLPGSVHATFHGADVRETLKALEYLMTIVVGYCAYRLDPSEKTMRVAFALITIVVTVLAFAQFAFPIGESERIAGHNIARIAGPLEGPNQFAGFLCVVVPVVLAFVLLRRALVVEWVALALGSVACILTFSRGGVAALVLVTATMLALRYLPAQRVRIGVGLAALFSVVLVLAFGVFAGILHGSVQALFGSSGEGTFNGGLGSRVDLWHGAYALWRTHPLFGIGAGNFELEVGRYFPGARTHANGIFFQVLAEQGIVGLIAALAVTVTSVVAFVRRLDEPLALGACAVGLAMAFHQIVDCMWLYPKVAVIWWVVLAVGAAVVDARAEDGGLHGIAD